MGSSIDMLNPKLRAAIASLGYRGLLPIQEKAIPVILTGNNTLVISPTGSGKTEAAVFPVVSMMLERFTPGDGTVKAIYITPLRALNRDVTLRISRIVESIGFTISLRHGDSTSTIRRRFLQSPPDFMVTTPESLNLLLTVAKGRDLWSSVSFVIVDEIQEMLDNKRGAELSVVLERLEEASRSRIQRVGLSATLSEKSKREAASLLAFNRPVNIVEDKGERRYVITVDVVRGKGQDEFQEAARRIAEIGERESGSVLVFTNTRSVAEKLASLIGNIVGDDNIAVHHGSLSRSVRETAEAKFREGKVKLMVATSSMELGIDIGSVNHVVQFMSPREVIAMTQRAGRSGHVFGGTSRATIVTFDNVFEVLESTSIARRTEKGELEDLGFPRSPLDVLAHQMTAMLVEGSADNIRRVHEIVARAAPLAHVSLDDVRKVAEHLDSVKVIRFDPETGEIKRSRRTFKYLYEVSMIPDEINFKVYDLSSTNLVGEVSERFVEVAMLTSGSTKFRFTLAGKVWEVVNIDYDSERIDAKPVGEAEGAIPIWEGELIPVSSKVAREVCSILSFSMMEPEKGLELLKSKGIDEETANRIVRVAEESRKTWGTVLTYSEPVVEESKGVSILYACLGSKGNLMLALLISKALESRMKVWFDYIPYAIVFSSPSGVPAEAIKDALEKLKSLDQAELVAMSYDAVRSTPLYIARFLQVAKKLGVIDPDARISLEQGRKAMEAYRGSIVDEETLKEIAFDKLDPLAVHEFLSNLREVHVASSSAPSPLFKEVINNPYLRRELATNIKEVAIDYIAEGLRRAALSKEALFLCTACGNAWRARVSDIGDSIRCPRCGAMMVAPLPATEWGEEAAAKYAAWRRGSLKKPNNDERKLIKEVQERAILYINYASQGLGRYVIEALMTSGVGPRAAKKVMQEYFKGGEQAFYKALLKAKEEYLVYKKFIDNNAGSKREQPQGHGYF
ncbi:Putative ATP-dependent helicase [Acidilobus saccharovorans 345-15]|uniref:Putative ATP-dependent helicase n=1 Tax=Acidilobus saccharovorans (strain DSM 16705 / JCM 18335 / VKM B-2471 / 345-15) TaxID=666510 RepID=D9Q0K6_ACIS3|nr:DEAD/DEAH box helicase [Acidilobus saccharovorans]ADL18844.1 Putative ATP-dependent helicase [Acidilobus saccharovorans 345-15]